MNAILYSVCYICVDEDTRSPGTVVTDGCEPLCGYCKSSPGLLQEQVLPPTTTPT